MTTAPRPHKLALVSVLVALRTANNSNPTRKRGGICRLLAHASGYCVPVVLAVLIVVNESDADETTETQAFENEPGWVWIVPPIEKESGSRPHVHIARHQPHNDAPKENKWRGFIAIMEEGKDQELLLVFARQGSFPNYYNWRPIAFDVDDKRHELRPRVAGGTGGVMLERWSSNPKTLPALRVAYVGLEGMTLEGFMREADIAARSAKERGLKVLPFPVVGKPYTFELTGLDGGVISTERLRGKVVLVDFWATWCGPCMQKMPGLKKLYASQHARGLEIVGVNFDDRQQACADAAGKLELRWQHAMAPIKEEERELWMKAMGLQTLGRTLLVDRNGILRGDSRADELDKLDSLVSDLLSEK